MLMVSDDRIESRRPFEEIFPVTLFVAVIFIVFGHFQASAAQAPSPTDFHDISASFAKDAIQRLAKRGIVSGMAQELFAAKSGYPG